MTGEPKCCTLASFESQLNVRTRMHEWTRETGAKVISVETLPMRVFCGGEYAHGFDTMHTWNKLQVRSYGSM